VVPRTRVPVREGSTPARHCWAASRRRLRLRAVVLLPSGRTPACGLGGCAPRAVTLRLQGSGGYAPACRGGEAAAGHPSTHVPAR
jgi:hypothetical protein